MIALRPATMDDAALLLAWRNEPEVRAQSFQTHEIEPGQHRDWLARVLADPARHLYIIVLDGVGPVGQMRFDCNRREAEVSVSLAREHRGRGRGAECIRTGTAYFLNEHPEIRSVVARIRAGNTASVGAFRSAGYAGQTERGGVIHLFFISRSHMPSISPSYQIIEIANVHGGDREYLDELIGQFSEWSGGFGMKFQPFKYDEIAVPDYEWYPTYQRLFFSEDEWAESIAKAGETKDVWIDVFDAYTVQIIRKNISRIRGLKFQASVLHNRSLFSALSAIDLSKCIVIVNVAGYDMDAIGAVAGRIEAELRPEEVVLQVGFQSYPTRFSDAGLSKLSALRDRFPYRLSFADHLAPEDPESLRLPAAAALLGASIIEKHVCHETRPTEFDAASSIPPSSYRTYIEILRRYEAAMAEPFQNDAERTYLKKTMQIPLAAARLSPGRSVSGAADLAFRRSPKEGISIQEIERLSAERHILARPKDALDAFSSDDFSRARISTIIACRLKSTRLPRKALAMIGDVSSIQLCIKNALRFLHVDDTVLATSTLPEDEPLREHTYADSVIFHRGDPVDVVNRYLGIMKKLGTDVVVRVTGDMQYVSNDIFQILLSSHFENGADYTNAKEAAVGTNLEIISAEALRRVQEYFSTADYSEYMTYYFWNNPSHFRLNFVSLPPDLVRPYRLTLDYPEDLELFRKIEEYFSSIGRPYDIRTLFAFLDAHPEIARINAHCALLYRTDPDLMERIARATTIR